MSNHTPGPWKVSHPYEDGGYTILPKVDPDKGGYKTEICSLNVELGKGCGSMKANAALIAAAPELLAACKFIAEHDTLHGLAKQNLLAVIAKAEGRCRTNPPQ